jgi:peptidoglycan/xylan/chitin deacetylase (PgdA/CDA1 family)
MAYSAILYLISHFFVPFLPMEGRVVATPPQKLPFSSVRLPAEDSLLKHIYLSFDDGPILGTSNCIAICTSHQVPATFFEVGLHQSRNQEGQRLYQEILQNEHLFAICNHSYSHAYGKYLPFYHHPKEAFADFIHAKDLIQPKNNILRLPGNNAWNTKDAKRASGLVRPLVHLLDSAGFSIIGWDMEWRFNKKGKPIKSPEVIVALVDSLLKLNQTVSKNHLVILMHDHMFRAPEDAVKLDKFIALLKQNPHYRFEKLTQYPGLKN